MDKKEGRMPLPKKTDNKIKPIVYILITALITAIISFGIAFMFIPANDDEPIQTEDEMEAEEGADEEEEILDEEEPIEEDEEASAEEGESLEDMMTELENQIETLDGEKVDLELQITSLQNGLKNIPHLYFEAGGLFTDQQKADIESKIKDPLVYQYNYNDVGYANAELLAVLASPSENPDVEFTIDLFFRNGGFQGIAFFNGDLDALTYYYSEGMIGMCDDANDSWISQYQAFYDSECP